MAVELRMVLADLHLSANTRDRYRHRILKRLAREAKRLGITQFYILGDLTEEKDRHNDWLTNQVVGHIHRFSELGRVTVLQGNHDYSSDPDMPFFRFIRHLPNVRWIGRPTTFSEAGLGRIVWLPHTRNYKNAWNGIPFKGASFVFAHGTFQGTVLEGGRKVREEGIPTSIFPKTTRVISGDVHIPQDVGPVTYVGAPYTVDFGDSYAARFLTIGSDGRVRSHPIAGPQKRLVVFTPDDPIEAMGEQCNSGDIIKIRASIYRSEAQDWPATREQLRDAALEYGCTVHSIVPNVIDDTPKGKRTIRKIERKGDAQVLKEYCQLQGWDQRMTKYGERFL